MKFRPCIDIHNGKVKQIIGGSLADKNSAADENFVSEYAGDYYAGLYRDRGLSGGHIILLNPVGSEYYEADRKQAFLALAAYPGGLQLGGGVTAENAAEYIEKGASHVIVTSYVFRDGRIDEKRLERLVREVGREHVVLDLSCRKKEDGYYIVTDRWQKFTETKMTEETLRFLSGSCDEFLIHAVDVEGKQHGIEEGVAGLLGRVEGITATYAGGIASFDDLERLKVLGRGKVDYTIGSALDLFGGRLRFEDVLAFGKETE